MAEAYAVIITEPAEQDLEGILDYIAQNSGVLIAVTFQKRHKKYTGMEASS